MNDAVQVQFSFGKELITVAVCYEERKALTIKVYPDKSVTARAPLNRTQDDVLRYLRKRAGWILRQRDYFDQFHPIQQERRYVSGETHYYLGRQYRLRIREGKKSQVKLVGRFFLMEIPDPTDSLKAKKMMLKWYSQHAKVLLQRRISLNLPPFLRLGANEPEVRFRRMKKRWGSCSPNGVVMLNTQLVKAPLQCIDYVVIHELCHLIHSHHNTSFYRLLGRVFPDWEKRKKRLETVAF
ncbi:MAG: M48 family metallopeptidase [bacterium]|nr:M48 family metallopeptidase [bacterium]